MGEENVYPAATAAERFAERLGNDGLRWEGFEELVEEMGATAQCGGETTRDPVRYVFPDGSAVVAAGDGWDVEGATAFSWKG